MTPQSVAPAPDPAVPQRDRLLDPDQVARRLSTRLAGRGAAVRIESCRLSSVCYRPATRLRVVYRLTVDGRDLHVAASTFPTSGRSEHAFRQAADTATDTGPLRPVVHDTELATVFWTFPNDRKLAHLSAVAEAQEDVARLAGGRWASSELVDYNPESTAVVRCLDDAGRVVAYAKVHADEDGERTHRVHSALARLTRAAGPRIARPLAFSGRHRTLLVEPIAGPSIGSLTGAERTTGLRAYGGAVAALHSLPPGDVERTKRDSLERLQRAADGVRMVLPAVAAQVTELLAELGARWGEADGPSVPIHGDTNENNAILDGDRVVLIDFDRAGVGAAGWDVGNYVGLLRYLRLLGVVTPAAARERAAAFTDGYASVRALPSRDSLRVHEGAVLAERAFHAVTRLRTSVLPHVPALLAEARRLLR